MNDNNYINVEINYLNHIFKTNEREVQKAANYWKSFDMDELVLSYANLEDVMSRHMPFFIKGESVGNINDSVMGLAAIGMEAIRRLINA